MSKRQSPQAADKKDSAEQDKIFPFPFAGQLVIPVLPSTYESFDFRLIPGIMFFSGFMTFSTAVLIKNDNIATMAHFAPRKVSKEDIEKVIKQFAAKGILDHTTSIEIISGIEPTGGIPGVEPTDMISHQFANMDLAKTIQQSAPKCKLQNYAKHDQAQQSGSDGIVNTVVFASAKGTEAFRQRGDGVFKHLSGQHIIDEGLANKVISEYCGDHQSRPSDIFQFTTICNSELENSSEDSAKMERTGDLLARTLFANSAKGGDPESKSQPAKAVGGSSAQPSSSKPKEHERDFFETEPPSQIPLQPKGKILGKGGHDQGQNR